VNDFTSPLPEVSMEEGLLPAALFYASLGLKILPLKPFTNIPWGQVLGTGYKMAEIGSSDPEQIRSWWSVNKMCNIGIVCGAPSGVLVLDLDVKNGGKPIQQLVQWQEETGIYLSRGAVSRTPSGGWHYPLRLPDGIGDVPSPVGWLPAVDVRADGSQVAVPPSVIAKKPVAARSFSDPKPTKSEKKWLRDHPTFVQYEWLDTAGQKRMPTPVEFQTALHRAVAPAELIEDIRTHRGTRGRVSSGLAAVAGKSSVPIEHYMAHGVPDGQQWFEFYRIVWSVISRYPVSTASARDPLTQQELAIRDQARKVIYRVRDKSPVGDPSNPWTDEDLDLMIHRALKRKRRDGDAVDRQRRTEKLQEELAPYRAAINNLSKGAGQ
jgi:bifunctional DNA primase/polymerase-like protein